MTAKKPGARERLLEHCDFMAEWCQANMGGKETLSPKTRRLLAAVLREAAEAGYYSRTIDQARVAALLTPASRRPPVSRAKRGEK